MLRAAVRAQRAKGVPVSIHPRMGDSTLRAIVEILRDEGAVPSRVIIGHLEDFGYTIEAVKEVGAEGYILAYDNFGSTNLMPTQGLGAPSCTPVMASGFEDFAN